MSMYLREIVSNITQLDDNLTDLISFSARVFVVTNTHTLSKEDALFPDVGQFIKCQEEEDKTGLPLKQENNMWVHTSGKIYVPKALRRKLLYYYHFSRAGGHQGVTRTYPRISKMFWWPDLNQPYSHTTMGV